MKATKIKETHGPRPDQRQVLLRFPEGYDCGSRWNSEAEQYEPTRAEFIIAIAADVQFSGPEVYLFIADADGEIVNWSELTGSQKGSLDIERVLTEAGIEVLP